MISSISDEDVMSFFKKIKIGNFVVYCNSTNLVYLILKIEIYDNKIVLDLLNMKKNTVIKNYEVYSFHSNNFKLWQQ